MRKNIVIFGLDDDVDILDLIGIHLQQSSIHNFRPFYDKEEFLKNFNETVHIALIDHYLNGKPVGYEIMQKVFEINERNKALIKCKVIITSGQQDPKMIAYYLNKGAFRYLDKEDPNFYKTLVSYVNIALDEVDSFYHSLDRWNTRMESINSIFKSVQ